MKKKVKKISEFKVEVEAQGLNESLKQDEVQYEPDTDKGEFSTSPGTKIERNWGPW